MRPPVVQGRRALLRVHEPFRRVAADRLRDLRRPLGQELAPFAFAPRRHVEQPVDRRDVAPLERKTVGIGGADEAFLPRLERDRGAAGEVAALDAEVVDLLGEIEDFVAFHAEIEERVEPLTAGVEVTDRALLRPLADLDVPRAEALALIARSTPMRGAR